MSLILTKANALCLHIPFCGGTWVAEALKKAGIETRPALLPGGMGSEHGLRHQYAETPDRAFVFVRHPLSWYESYFVRSSANLGPPLGEPIRNPLNRMRRFLPFAALHECLDADFNQFANKCLERQPGFVSRMFEWYVGPPGAAEVDFVGTQEHLASDLRAILKHLDYPGCFARIEKYPKVNERDDSITTKWDPVLRQAVLRAERPAIERFYARERTHCAPA